MNTRTVNAMKRHTDECVQRMKQIAGKVSGDIIRQASALEDVLPSDIKEESDITMVSFIYTGKNI